MPILVNYTPTGILTQAAQQVGQERLRQQQLAEAQRAQQIALQQQQAQQQQEMERQRMEMQRQQMAQAQQDAAERDARWQAQQDSLNSWRGDQSDRGYARMDQRDAMAQAAADLRREGFDVRSEIAQGRGDQAIAVVQERARQNQVRDQGRFDNQQTRDATNWGNRDAAQANAQTFQAGQSELNRQVAQDRADALSEDRAAAQKVRSGRLLATSEKRLRLQSIDHDLRSIEQEMRDASEQQKSYIGLRGRADPSLTQRYGELQTQKKGLLDSYSAIANAPADDTGSSPDQPPLDEPGPAGDLGLPGEGDMGTPLDGGASSPAGFEEYHASLDPGAIYQDPEGQWRQKGGYA